MAAGKGGAVRAGRAFVEVFADANPLQRGLKAAGNRLRSFGTLVGGIGASMAAAFIPMIKSAADAEKAAISFEVLLGSAEKAAKAMSDLREFAASTPFELPELTDATRKLLAFGFSQEELIDTLRAVGDVSAGIDAPIAEIAEIYGKARVQGRLFMEDINQLTGRGIPVIQELAKQFGVAESDVRKLVETGQVSFDHLEVAFQSLTGEGGKFGGMMERLSGSMAGRWSTLMDTISESGRKVGEALLPALKPIVEELTKVAEHVSVWAANNPDLVKTVAAVVAILAASGGLAWALGSIVVALSGPVGVIALTIGLTAALMKAAEAYGVFGTSAADAARQQALFQAQLDQGAKARADVAGEKNAAAVEAGPEAVQARRNELGDEFRALQKEMSEQSRRIEEMKADQGWFISQAEEDELQTQVDHYETLQQRLNSVLEARKALEAAVNAPAGGATGEASLIKPGERFGDDDASNDVDFASTETAEQMKARHDRERAAEAAERVLEGDADVDRLRRTDAVNTGAVVGTQSAQDAIIKALTGDAVVKELKRGNATRDKMAIDIAEMRRGGIMLAVGAT